MERRTRPWFRAAATVASFVALAPAPGDAQFVQGLVAYTYDDLPVALATVSLIDGSGEVVAQTTSGLDGHFALPIPAAGAYSVHVEHLTALSVLDGPLSLNPEASTFVLFHLQPRPLVLEELSVEVEGRSMPLVRNGFYERRRISTGAFVSPEEVEHRPRIRTSDFLRTIPGVQYLDAHGSAGFDGFPVMSYALRSRADPSRPLCFPRVYVDGVIMEQGGFQTPATGFDAIVRAHDVAAMEVYRSPAEIPAQFGGMTACGVILLWTRHGLARDE